MADDRYADRSHMKYYPPPLGPENPDYDEANTSVDPLRIHKTTSPAPRTSQGERKDSASTASSGRHRFSADDPSRPSVSGYSRNPSAPKPLPDSPGPDLPEKDRLGPAYPVSGPGSSADAMPMPEQYMPRPLDTTQSQLGVNAPSSVNRTATHASVNTTRAEAGSPAPPETPIDPQQTTNYNPAAAAMSSAQSPQARPARVQAQAPINANAAHVPVQMPQPAAAQPDQHILNGQAVQGLSLQDEPPPAYTTAGIPSGHATGIQDVKARPQPETMPVSQSPVQPVMQDAATRTHPAFANDLQRNMTPSHPAAANIAPIQTNPYQQQFSPPPPALAALSPPPLPEGWISHLDPNSGQYYYIHLPTQSTQWEFPKGPTPLALQEPQTPNAYPTSMHSPSFSTHTLKPPYSPGISSPGVQSHMGPYYDGLSVPGVTSPTNTIFSGPPPAGAVELYRVAPTNGVYFGPFLRYTNIDLERSLWLGSIMIITDAQQPPTIHIHQSTDLSPNPRQLKANPIYSHHRWLFYRYDIDLLMEDGPTKWTYAVTSHLGCTRYEFIVAGRHETNWRFITHSGNDFALSVNPNERAKVGGLGLMWKDVLQKHQECGGFHVQLGLGGQIYADRLWHDLPMLKQWISMSGKENRKNAPWSAKLEEDVIHAYFHFYTSHFDQPHIREAFAQIPSILTLDDHDM